MVNARETDAASLAPVRQLGEASLVYLRASNVYLLAVTKRNSNAMMIMQFLSRVRGGGGWGWVGAFVWCQALSWRAPLAGQVRAHALPCLLASAAGRRWMHIC